MNAPCAARGSSSSWLLSPVNRQEKTDINGKQDFIFIFPFMVPTIDEPGLITSGVSSGPFSLNQIEQNILIKRYDGSTQWHAITEF